ncbi:MAG: tetratricopeptide repeat protein [Planctomycetota bacterium]|nr:MAG: tetratricopeptide repeat protein [Planctomycetota bacterium]
MTRRHSKLILLSVFIFLVTAFLITPAARGEDVIYLENGQVVKGRVLENTKKKVVIKTRRGIVTTFPKSEVERIEYGPDFEKELKQKFQKARTADDFFKLGNWCKESGEDEEAEKCFRKALEKNPDHEGARKALGYIRHEGKWYAEEDYYTNVKGMVRHKGSWITKKELEELKLKKEREKAARKEKTGQKVIRVAKKNGNKIVRSKSSSKKRHSKGRGGAAGTHNLKVKTDDGERKYVLTVPKWAASGKPAPLVVLLHGTNSRPSYMLQFWRPVAGKDAILAAPWAIAGKWSNESPEKDIKFVLAMVEQVKKRYNIDLNRIYVAGHSRGGFFTFTIGVPHGDVFAACGILAGGANYYRNPSERRAPFYIWIVERDPSVPASSARDAKAVLEKNGHEVLYHEVPGGNGTAADHELTRACCQECWDFMKKKKWAPVEKKEEEPEKKDEPKKEKDESKTEKSP